MLPELTDEEAAKMEVSTYSNAKKLPGLDCENVVKTVDEFNEAVNDAPFDPSKHDGKCTRGISPANRTGRNDWTSRRITLSR
jgi:hypothetical protein